MELSPVVSHELFRLMCGKQLGSGIARQVFESRLNPNEVFKFETSCNSFQNVTEWNTWKSVQYTEFAEWFAPCLHISPCGTILVQARTKPPTKEQYPHKVPAFFTDMKRENFGMLGGRIVAHDYGLHLMLERGQTKRMRIAHWWEADE